jgi:rfaE bifunctional protein nucleotidyltransferase chain/domain
MEYLAQNLQNKIVAFNELDKIIQQWKSQNQKLVFTNGCFDIIHLGHIDYLSKSKKLGDKLIIGLNSDFSVRNIKGNSRPIQDEKSRSAILAAFYFVDLVVIFDEDTPIKLISKIIPDVLVKGADYKKSEIVGFDVVSENGGDVITLDFLPGYSTSAIEKKIIDSQK